MSKECIGMTDAGLTRIAVETNLEEEIVGRHLVLALNAIIRPPAWCRGYPLSLYQGLPIGGTVLASSSIIHWDVDKLASILRDFVAEQND